MVALTIIFNAKSMTYGIPSKTAASSPADDIAMRSPLSCLLGGPTSVERDRRRVDAIATLNLLSLQTIPVFDEATQTAARLLAMPISILSVMESKTQRFKSVVGLSSLGLMNPLAATRAFPRAESFCTHVIDSGKPFALEDTTTHPAFSSSLLVQQYGIQSYLGVPLITSEGCCIGTLAVMDLLPHSFTQQEIAFLELTARWAMSEFESQRMLSVISSGSHLTQSSKNSSHSISPTLSKINQIRFDLVVQLTQDLRNPLTSITGMANMLSREIYGPLSAKQQEYANIVLSSSQQLLSMVNEIVEVGDLKADNYQLELSQVDIEMVGQQAIAALESLTKQQELEVRLTVEPSSHLWTLDKRVVKQIIYHLVFSVVKMSTAGSTIRIHISRKDDNLNLSLWVSNPWLGEDLPQALINWEENSLSQSIPKKPTSNVALLADYERIEHTATLAHLDSDEVFAALATAQRVDASRQELGLLLSRHLTKMHGGEALIQGSAANGYRYIISLPAS
ncbi:MAG: histidine kinase [Leptolyngbya foveolarum]|uniref:histidine kinase n=1 Tax=Leptolyngbya foveolarum TaxID=47253 RepID=A0A2W4UGJ8_9CYAN|nr:MAG: histidine kinase [Leptolyngbya foveolarum]